jgi:S-formylglutathione hydrolase FrmB
MSRLLILFLLLSFRVQGATVDTVTIHSAFLKKDTRFVIVLPAAKKPGTRFPVVYLLHGYSGNYAQWLRDAPQLGSKADELQVMLVSPDGGYGSWYFDSPIDSAIRYESYIIKELTAYIDSHYPSIPLREGRAVTGLSMGGHGALYLASRHSDLFGAAGSICGGVDFRPFPENWDIKKALGTFSENSVSWDSAVVINVMDRLKDRELALIIDCGIDDFFLEVNRALHRKLVERKIAHDYTERPGAHNREYWRNSIDYQLIYFSKYFMNSVRR